MSTSSTIEEQLSAWLKKGFKSALSETQGAEADIAVAATTREDFGDYQCNAAMGLARAVKWKPRELAAAALAAAGAHPAVARAEVAGAGFINVFLRDEWIAQQAAEQGLDPRLGAPMPGQGRTIVLDYSSPNVAKPMHIGHIRSTVIGNALDRLLRFLGYRVIADNHLGDWGTQFGILILGYRHFVRPDAMERSPVEELERVYVESYRRAKEDPAWMEQARAELVKLQAGDPENLALWSRFVEWSLAEFERIYRRLGVTFDLVRGESYYNDQLPGVIEKLREAGLARESEGALVVDLESEGLPVCIVRKRDGAYNYATTDLATMLSREEEFHPDAMVYVTDERQQLHFRQIFAIARRLGVTAQLEHVWFGLMRLPEGTFSTRDGNVIRLERLLDEAEARALAIVQANDPTMPEERQREVARCVGIGAVKYADLSQNPQSIVTFTWEKALALDGNSAPYLQYAYARIASVREKYAERFPDRDPETLPIRFAEPVERRLALQTLRFPDALLRAAAQYRPNLLADYLFETAQIYSRFYQTVPILRAEENLRESRVRLCAITARVLRQGLNLLGIDTPERI